MERNAYDKAVSLLALREHTGKELEAKLIAKGFSREESREAVEKLRREGFLSEERFAEVFVRSRLRKTPEGRSVLIMRMVEKGTPRAVAEAAVAEAWERGDYREPLRELYGKYAAKKGEEYACGILMQKGFSYREVMEVKGSDGDE